jgi:hypothetical protein
VLSQRLLAIATVTDYTACFTLYCVYVLALYNQKLIKDRRAEGLEGRNDTLSEMIRGTSGGEHMTDEEIQDQVRTSFLQEK